MKTTEITISRKGQILAHHITESCLSNYSQAVWVIEDESPAPGLATWRQGDNIQQLDIMDVRGGWLICKQSDGCLCGIIWSDGSYHADLLVDADEQPAIKLEAGLHIKDTIQFDPNDPNDLGAILS